VIPVKIRPSEKKVLQKKIVEENIILFSSFYFLTRFYEFLIFRFAVSIFKF